MLRKFWNQLALTLYKYRVKNNSERYNLEDRKEMSSRARETNTYISILLLVVGSTSFRYFKGDIASWEQAIFEICEKYRERVPELEEICFNQESTTINKSEEVFCFLAFLMGQSDFRDCWPGDRFSVPSRSKSEFRKQYYAILANHRDWIEDMARILEKYCKSYLQEGVEITLADSEKRLKFHIRWGWERWPIIRLFFR